MKKTPKFQINDLILKKKSNHVFQVVKVFNIGKRTSKYRLPNSHYVFLLDILKDVIAEFKKLDEVMV